MGEAGGGTLIPDCSATHAPRKHGNNSSHSKVFNLVTLYKIPNRVCLFIQVASPVFDKKCFLLCRRLNLLQIFFLSLNLLLLWKSREKNNLFSRRCSCLLPLVKYRSCCVINFSIIFQTSLMWLYFCKVRAIRGDH